MRNLEITGAITAFANALAAGLTVDEIAILAGLFVQLGDTLATIAALDNLCGAKEDEKIRPFS